MHNTPEQNKTFRDQWDETNRRYIANTPSVICALFKRRHDTKACKNALIDAFNYVLDGFTIVGKRLYSHNGMRFCRYVWDEQQTANKQDDAK